MQHLDDVRFMCGSPPPPLSFGDENIAVGQHVVPRILGAGPYQVPDCGDGRHAARRITGTGPGSHAAVVTPLHRKVMAGSLLDAVDPATGLANQPTSGYTEPVVPEGEMYVPES